MLQKGRKSFSPLPGALPPAHASPAACSASATANISKHPDGKARQGGFLFFFTTFIFFPFLIALLLDPLKQAAAEPPFFA